MRREHLFEVERLFEGEVGGGGGGRFLIVDLDNQVVVEVTGGRKLNGSGLVIPGTLRQ